MQSLRQTFLGLFGVTFVAALATGASPTHHIAGYRFRVIASPANYQYLHDPMYDLTPGLLRPDGRLINGLLPTYPDAQG